MTLRFAPLLLLASALAHAQDSAPTLTPAEKERYRKNERRSTQLTELSIFFVHSSTHGCLPCRSSTFVSWLPATERFISCRRSSRGLVSRISRRDSCPPFLQLRVPWAWWYGAGIRIEFKSGAGTWPWPGYAAQWDWPAPGCLMLRTGVYWRCASPLSA